MMPIAPQQDYEVTVFLKQAIKMNGTNTYFVRRLCRDVPEQKGDFIHIVDIDWDLHMFPMDIIAYIRINRYQPEG